MDGYYEWAKVGSKKQPYLIEPAGEDSLAMAGLWERNKKLGSDGEPLFTLTIITTAANETTKDVHDRMPVFLPDHEHERWLDPAYAETDALKTILKPAPEDWLKLTPVAKTVGNVRIDDESCVQPLEITPQQSDAGQISDPSDHSKQTDGPRDENRPSQQSLFDD